MQMVPTVGHVRDVLVRGLRHLAEAEQRAARWKSEGSRVRRVFHGVDNRKAIEIMRQTMRGRDRKQIVSLLTWQIARSLGNATRFTEPLAWWNAERWQLPDRRVAARLAALQRGEATPGRRRP